MRNKLIPVVALFFLVQSLLLSGCRTMDALDGLGAIQVGGFSISESQMASIKKTAKAMGRAFTDITPEQEYYIGRAVGAKLLGQYHPYDDQRINRYLNLIGRSLAAYSEMPETFGGYHFLLLDDPSINAFAAPGGLIFVSRGMLRCCLNEDEVAAVLAHEIAHVQLKHGLQAIKKGRLTNVFSIMATEGVKQLAAPEIAELTNLFEDSIHDVTSTLVNSGYSRAFERQADAAALNILARTGYDPLALNAMLGAMAQRLDPQGLDFAKTHPDPKERIKELEPLLAGRQAMACDLARYKRFKNTLGKI
ncbi:MAG: M48 family metalloprotease [Desulfobulbaceae bacterium]|nr:M48 family metalloprotease [Desulfobulbaceae bacterium]HIJ78589.1 M48 family metalloprotease [Deltaproteobacteria bacterium]